MPRKIQTASPPADPGSCPGATCAVAHGTPLEEALVPFQELFEASKHSSKALKDAFLSLKSMQKDPPSFLDRCSLFSIAFSFMSFFSASSFAFSISLLGTSSAQGLAGLEELSELLRLFFLLLEELLAAFNRFFQLHYPLKSSQNNSPKSPLSTCWRSSCGSCSAREPWAAAHHP